MNERISIAEYKALLAEKKPQKYRNEPVVVDGIRFASKFEAKRWGDLRILEQLGRISDLQRQVSYPLHTVGGAKITTYVADFVYLEPSDELVVEDAKGYETPEFKKKAKWMLSEYGVTVRLVKSAKATKFKRKPKLKKQRIKI